MVEFSSNCKHFYNIKNYFEAVIELTEGLTGDNLDDRLAAFSETLQYIRDDDICYSHSLSEIEDMFRDQDILLEDDAFFISIIVRLIQQGSNAISHEHTFLILNSEEIARNVRFIVEYNYLKILSDSHPPEALVFIRSSLFELASVRLCNIDTVTRHRSIDEDLVCTPVPSYDIQFYQEVVRSNVVRAAFIVLDVDYTGERLDRAIEFICSSNKLYYASMPPRNYGFTSNGFVYINHGFSNSKHDETNLLRLFTLLHETAHVIVRINEPVEKWRFTSSPYRSIAYEKCTDRTGSTETEEGWALEAKIFQKVPEYVYVGVTGFLFKLSSWNLELKTFQDRFLSLQENGRIRGEERVIVCSSIKGLCAFRVKCGTKLFLGTFGRKQDEQDTCKKRLAFEDIPN